MTTTPLTTLAPPFAMDLVCPACGNELAFEQICAHCHPCDRTYMREGQTWNFVIGGTFEDGAIPESQKAYESDANANTVENFWLPLFRRFFPDGRRARILSVGCGVGMDVDLLCRAGFDCFGIDCGHRDSLWCQREQCDHLLLANGKHLPFPDESFDLVFCGCVFPHVGVVGDTNEVAANGQQERLDLAREMTRVLKKGGRVVTSSPNRWFPADLFHGREHGGYKPRFNPPTSHFLLSAGDYEALFRAAGCDVRQSLPVRGYWGFIRSSHTWKGRLLGWPVRTLLHLSDFALLRNSPLSPWIVVSMEKVSADKSQRGYKSQDR